MEITIISLVVLLVILGGVCWFLWKRSKNLPTVETKKEEKKYVKTDSSNLLVVTDDLGEPLLLQGGVFEETPGYSYSVMPLSAITWDGVVRVMSSENVFVNIPVSLTASVGSTNDSRKAAVSKFLSSGRDGIKAFLGSVAESSIKSSLVDSKISDLLHSDDLREKSMEIIKSNLSVVGLEILAFSISELSDDADYIKSLSQKEIGKIKTAAQSELIAQQKLDAIQAEKDKTELEVAKNEAELERRTARQDSDAKLREIRKQEAIADADAEREIQVKTAEIRADQNRKIAYSQAATEQTKEEARIKKDLAISKARSEATKSQETLEIQSSLEIEKSRKQAEIEVSKAELEKERQLQEIKNNNFLEDQEARKQSALAQEAASQEINAAKTQTSLAKVESDSVIERTRLEKAAELEKLKELQKVEISKASEKAKEAEINATVILETKKKNEKAELEAKAKKNISKINAEAQAEKTSILSDAEAKSIEKKAIAQANGKRADLLAEADKIKALEETSVESVKSLLAAGLAPEIILQIRTVEQVKNAAEATSGLLEKLNLSDVTILGDSKTVGDFITQTTAGVSPALDKLRSLPLTKAAKVIEED